MSTAKQLVPGPPDLKKCDPVILQVAKFLRQRIEKQRTCILGGKNFDMFRVKRAVRALLSPEYAKERQKNNLLPEIPDNVTALKLIAKFPEENFAFNVVKLDTNEAISKGFKPRSGIPVCLIPPQQRVAPNEYFVWYYNPIPLKVYLYTGGLLLAGVAAALFQLWPSWARRGVYYLSMVCVGFVGFLLAVTVIRLVLFLITTVVGKGLWLFPNLYADVSLLQSFQPVFAWSGTKTLPQKEKLKKRKSRPMSDFIKKEPNVGNTTPVGDVRANMKGPVPGIVPGAIPGPLPAGAPPGNVRKPPPPIIQQAINVCVQRTDARIIAELKKSGPKSPAEIEQMKQLFFKEEWSKAEAELAQKANLIQQMQKK
ncbi:Sec63 complex subunit [Starmerella bacillaris]|uniref:Translocation protein SEC62 n=1 Tax=Starmerella bacillaris TaxID=1247836 RepID=A0AAV5RMR6_STABA|nr:Sec63 complex subunit [Starmerella bacillaris]